MSKEKMREDKLYHVLNALSNHDDRKGDVFNHSLEAWRDQKSVYTRERRKKSHSTYID